MHGGDRVRQLDAGHRPARLDHREHQRRGAELEVGGDLGQVRVTDDHVQPAVFVGVGVRLVPGVDDAALQRGLQADLDLDVVRSLAQLETLGLARRSDPHPTGAGEHLAGREERGQPGDDRRERGVPAAQVVLVGAVGGALAVDVVLVHLDGFGSGQRRRQPGGRLHHPLAGLVEEHPVQRVGHLRRGELRVGVIDVQPGTVGQDHVRRADVVDIGLGGAEQRAQVVAPGVPQRRFDLVVPPGPARPRCGDGGRIGEDHLGRGDHRVHSGLSGHRDAVLDLGTHDAAHSHGSNLVRQDQSHGPSTADHRERCGHEPPQSAVESVAADPHRPAPMAGAAAERTAGHRPRRTGPGAQDRGLRRAFPGRWRSGGSVRRRRSGRRSPPR